MDVQKLLEMANSAKTKISARSGGIRPVKPPQGQSRWRILPGWDAPENIHAVFGQHFIKDIAGNIVGSFVCPQASSDDGSVSCKHCDEVAAVKRLAGKDKDAAEKIDEFRAGSSYLFNAIRMDEGDKKTVVLLSMPASLAGSFFTNMVTYLDEGINILDPNEGHDIFINREGSGINTKYNITVSPKSTAVGKESIKGIINIENYIATETERGRSNIDKFTPTLAAAARSVGLPSGEIMEAIETADAFAIGSDSADMKAIGHSSGDEGGDDEEAKAAEKKAKLEAAKKKAAEEKAAAAAAAEKKAKLEAARKKAAAAAAAAEAEAAEAEEVSAEMTAKDRVIEEDWEEKTSASAGDDDDLESLLEGL